MRLTKSAINKIIRWSGSIYCEHRKKHVVQLIYDCLHSREGKRTFTTGSYSERGHLGGWQYTVDGAQSTLIVEDGNTTETYTFSHDKKNDA